MRLVAVMPTVGLSSASGNERAMAMLQQWIAAVDEHRAGESDAALAKITAWTYDDLEMMRAYVETVAGAPTERTRNRERRRTLISSDDLVAIREKTKDLTLRGDFNTFRKRAAILHTDAALLGGAPVVVPP